MLSHKNTILVDPKVASRAVNLHAVCRVSVCVSLVCLHMFLDQSHKIYRGKGLTSELQPVKQQEYYHLLTPTM